MFLYESFELHCLLFWQGLYFFFMKYLLLVLMSSVIIVEFFFFSKVFFPSNITWPRTIQSIAANHIEFCPTLHFLFHTSFVSCLLNALRRRSLSWGFNIWCFSLSSSPKAHFSYQALLFKPVWTEEQHSNTLIHSFYVRIFRMVPLWCLSSTGKGFLKQILTKIRNFFFFSLFFHVHAKDRDFFSPVISWVRHILTSSPTLASCSGAQGLIVIPWMRLIFCGIGERRRRVQMWERFLEKGLIFFLTLSWQHVGALGDIGQRASTMSAAHDMKVAALQLSRFRRNPLREIITVFQCKIVVMVRQGV